MIKETRNPAPRYITSQLQFLARQIETEVAQGNYPTRDELRLALNGLICRFFQTLKSNYVSGINFNYLERLDPSKLAKLVMYSGADIGASYARVGEAQDEIESRINRYFTVFRGLKNRVAHINNAFSSITKVTETGILEIGDTFSDSSKLAESASQAAPLLAVNREAGLVTLPRVSTTGVDVARVQLLPTSNGQISLDSSIDNLIDNNLDTKFEYIRQVEESDDTELRLDILVTFRLAQVFNNLRIIPLIQDDKEFANIESIETSLDGKVFQDIRTSLPTLLDKSEEDALFTLGPVGFRNQSLAEFFLTPRTARFVKIQIRQAKKTERARDFIQRIGLRDIVFNRIAYSEIGELSSVEFDLPFAARRLTVEDRKTDTEPLTSLTYQISVDGGITFNSLEANDVIEYNTGGPNSTDISNQTNTVQVRIVAQREDENFNGVAEPLGETIRQISESVNIDQVPVTLGLESIPTEGSFEIFETIASIGEGPGTVLANVNGEDNIQVELPIAVRPFTETIRVNGTPWTRVNSLRSSEVDDTAYEINYTEGTVKFGNNLDGQVPQGEVVMMLDAERALVTESSPFIVDLENTHDFDPEHISVTWVDRPRKVVEEALARGTNEFRLTQDAIVRTIETLEDIPANVREFYFQGIPDIDSRIEFTDREVFGTRVSTTPANPGEYKVTQLVSGVISPVKVDTFTSTNGAAPGQATFEALGTINNPRDSYSSETFTSLIVDRFSPLFSDEGVFANERTFVDGSSELATPGDYSIDYQTGTVYSFNETSETGTQFITYHHRPSQELDWDFNTEPNQLVITDDSLFVNRNDFSFITITDDAAERYFVIFQDRRFIRIRYNDSYIQRPEEEFQNNDPVLGRDQGRAFVPSSDFLRGQILPPGKTRVRLPHQGIIRNSVRFTFLSDDKNAFDDRIVTNTNGVITVSPKPVKDDFGSSLTGSLVGITTQRDVDKTTLNNEVDFVDGRVELTAGGDYSIDYLNGILYTFTPIPASCLINYEYTDIRVTYYATQKLIEDQEYELNLSNLELNIKSIGNPLVNQAKTLLLRYRIIQDFNEDPTGITDFYSPILFGYTLRVQE